MENISSRNFQYVVNDLVFLVDNATQELINFHEFFFVIRAEANSNHILGTKYILNIQN